MQPDESGPELREEPAEVQPKRHRRFTLADLVVIVSISCVFIGLMALAVTRMRESAHRTACSGNFHQIGMAMSSYAGDYGEHFPCVRSDSMTAPMAPGEGTRSMALLYPSYCDNSKTFSCPSKSSNWHNFELPGFAALPNSDPRLKWSSSYWYDYRHRDDQLSTIVIAGEAAAETGWSPTASRGYYRPVSHQGRGANLMFVGARVMWVNCVPGGTAMAGESAIDPNVYIRNPASAQHDTCLVN